MGRLGVIGSSPAPTTSGRLGRIGGSTADTTAQAQQASDKQKNDALIKQRADDLNAKVAQSKADIWNPLKILGDIGNGAKGFVNDTFVQPAVTLTKQVQTAIKGGQTAFNGGAGLSDPVLVKNQENFIRGQQAKGVISKDKADAAVSKLSSDAATKQANLGQAEKETGVKYDPSAGANALIDTATNLTGLGEIPKVVFKAAATKLSAKLGRDLTETELTNLAQKTKATVPASATTTPVVEAPVKDLRQNTRLSAPETPVIRTNVPKINSTISEDLKTVPNIDTKIKTVKAGDLHMGSDTMGTEIDPRMVDKYKTDIQSGKPIDPIVVSKDKDGQLFVQDGQHRLEAAKQLGITDIPTVEQLPKNTPIKESVTENLKPTEITQPVEKPAIPPEKPVGDTVSGNSLRIQQKAVEEKLTKTMGDLPQYKSLNMKEQSEKATDLVTKDRQKAIDIIDGKANPPDGLHSQAVHQALEVAAIKEKDGALLLKLANSHINTELSEGAQKLRIAAERDPMSATEQIRQIQDARAKKAKLVGGSVKKETEKAINTVAKSTRINTKQELASFIKELQC